MGTVLTQCKLSQIEIFLKGRIFNIKHFKGILIVFNWTALNKTFSTGL